MLYKVQKVQKYALNLQLQALQIFTNDDEVENLSLSSFLLAVQNHLVTMFCSFCKAFCQISFAEKSVSFNLMH